MQFSLFFFCLPCFIHCSLLMIEKKKKKKIKILHFTEKMKKDAKKRKFLSLQIELSNVDNPTQNAGWNPRLDYQQSLASKQVCINQSLTF